MPIDNRSLVPGTTLVTTYKKIEHHCEVVATDQGVRYRLADGREFGSSSAAGKAVTGRVSCDGWKFWSVAGTEPRKAATTGPAATPAPTPLKPKTSSGVAKLVRQINKLPNQKGVPEGSTKWFCSACMKSFLYDGRSEPAVCPEGHPRRAADEFGGGAAEAIEVPQGLDQTLA
jgi:hypothetical protein